MSLEQPPMTGPGSSEPSMDRRRFMKALGATGAAAAGLSVTGTPIQRAEAVPWLAAGAVAAGAAIGLDYMMGTGYTEEVTTRAANYIHRRFGDDRNYGEYTGATALQEEIAIGGNEMKLADEKVMTSIQNNIQAADNVAYSKGQVAVVEALNNGKSESEADAKMKDAIDKYFSKIQENILIHYNTQADQIRHHYNKIAEHADLTADGTGSIFWIWGRNTSDETVAQGDTGLDTSTGYTVHETGAAFAQTANVGSATYNTIMVELLDGTKKESERVVGGSSDNYWAGPFPGTSTQADGVVMSFGIKDTDGSVVEYFYPYDYWQSWDEVIATRDSVLADLSGFVTDIYAAYEPGEVDLAGVVDPTTFATELATDTDSEAYRQAAAAQLGIPTSATENVSITIHGENEVTIQTDLYTDHSPTDGFQVGETYNPSSWTEPLFVTYPDSETGEMDIAQLEDSFTIEAATGPEGNAVDSFDTVSTNAQSANTEELKANLDQLRETQQEMLANQSPTDGGGGSSGGPPGFVSWLSDDSIGRAVGAEGVPNAVPAVGGVGGIWAWLSG